MIKMIVERLGKLELSLTLKIVISIIVLMTLLVGGLFFLNVQKYEQTAIRNAAIQADEIAEVVKAGLKTTMRLEPRKDTRELVNDVGKLAHIESVTIYDKKGVSQFSSTQFAPEGPLPKTHSLCVMCHATETPDAYAPLSERSAVVSGTKNGRLVRIVSPIPNDPNCSTSGCHVKQRDNSYLGILELTVSLENIEGNISLLVLANAKYALFSLIAIFITILGIIYFLVDRPIDRMIEGTRRISLGEYDAIVEVDQNDELGMLARSINRMARDVGNQHDELSKQHLLYQSLFEGVPCLITVQDKNYQLMRYNQTFAQRFNAKPGDYCYHAYKGRDCKCEVCPVEKTFEDGKSHTTEEVGYYKDGSEAHWIVNTAPIFDENGEIVAAMEMCLDITQRKRLEEYLKASEQKYYAIFNNIPNAVLVLDAQSLEIIDCNQTAIKLYGYKKGKILRRSFLELVAEGETERNSSAALSAHHLKRTKHATASGETFWASTSTTYSEFDDKPVLLTVVTDISERIRSDEQLVQASKMATLGEMATGVAHELNQPLAVLQMVANVFKRKLKTELPIDAETAKNMSEKISNNVERAAKIINHMREFGRKSTIEAEEVNLNTVILRSFDFFSQQLKLHDILVEFELTESLPPVQADPNRMEQVFINMLLNARDAIDEKCAVQDCAPPDRIIILRTRFTRRKVIAEIHDSGTGIAKDILPRLFEPFFTTKDVGKGTGLGLSISYGIVHDYGGTIHVTTSPETGSRFVITLPRT